MAADWSDYVIRQATEEEQRARDRLTFAAWGEKLTVYEYVAREAALRQQAWARENMQTWLLLEGVRVVSSCEAFRMLSTLKGEAGFAYAIASVFTEPHLRKRGYAARLVDGVCKQLASDGQAQSVILFSDVGAALYERLRFVARPAFDCVLPAELGDPGAEVKLLSPGDAAHALAQAVRPQDEYLVWPNAVQLDWHAERARYYARVLRSMPVSTAGAECDGATIFWAGDFRNNRLRVLLLDAPSSEVAARLLTAAQRTAARSDLREVCIWQTPSTAVLGSEAGVVRERQGGLPMIRPLKAFSAEAWRTIPRAIWV